MEVGILGPLEVRADGAVVALGGARMRTLLLRLALDAGRAVSVDALSEALWPTDTDGPADRVHALHALVSRLRRALPADRVRSVPGGYRLDVAPDAVDAARFERLAGAGRAALHDRQPGTAAGLLREALALWRGPALADAGDAAFAAAAVARLDELRLAALEDCAEAELAAGADPHRLVAELRAVTAAHPARERAHALMLHALHADGRPAEALERYAEVRTALAERFGVDPSPQLRAAHLAVLHAESGPRQATRPGRRRGNLRPGLTSFVGRREELATVRERLAAGRLVTLTGPGGAGKTRLATKVALDSAAGLRGGAWLAELGAVRDPAEVVSAVLGVFGGTGATGATARDPLGRLVDAIPAEPALLVLDNCEHLLDAVSALSEELLGSCPSLRVLVTSREPLGIPAEALVPVPPLPVAGPGASAEEMLESPAVRLFAARAAAVVPGFAATPANAGVVAEICRRLDGLPLAIELAAARTRSVPVEHLATMLDDRFGNLAGGNRTAPLRHRTLAAVVAWSWDLLTDDERGLLEALSVFPGPVTVEAAEHVGPAVPVSPLLAALVDKSLLHVADGPELRYRMLETVREFGTRRLAERGTLDEARAAHARYFLARAETAAPHLRGAGQLRWIPTLVADRENLLGALRFATTTGDADTAVRLASAMSFLLTLHGDHVLATRLLRPVLDLPATASPRARAGAVAAYLLNCVLSGAVDDADLERFRAAAGSGHPSAFAIGPLVTVLSGGPDADPASLEPPPQVGPFGRAMIGLVRAMLRGNRGDPAQSCRELAAAAELFQEAGERWGAAVSLTRLGIARLLVGDSDGAVAALGRARVPARELGDDHHQRMWLATALAHTGDTAAARAELAGLLACAPAAHHLAVARLRLGDIERFDGDLPAAAREYAAAGAAGGRGHDGDPAFVAAHRSSLAHLAVARGDAAEARAELRAAFAAATATSDVVLLAGVGCALADLLAALGRPADAAVVLGAAHCLRGAADPLHPDVVRVTAGLRLVLGGGYATGYDRGRSLGPAAATALLRAELDA